MVNSALIISNLQSLGYKLFRSNQYSETKVILEDLDSFIEIAKDLNVQHIFYNVEILSENDVELSFVTEDMLSDIELPDEAEREFRKEITRHNKEVSKLRESIGKEQSFEFSFVHQGAIYIYEQIDLSFYTDDPEDILRDLVEDFEEEIKEHKQQKRLEKQRTVHQMLSRIENTISSNEDFKHCTNDSSRRIFAFNFYEKMQDFFVANKIGIFELQEYVSYLWGKHKDDVKKLK